MKVGIFNKKNEFSMKRRRICAKKRWFGTSKPPPEQLFNQFN